MVLATTQNLLELELLKAFESIPFLNLKTELGTTVLAGLPHKGVPREQLFHIWKQWLQWALKNPEKRRTLALLEGSDDITAESHQAVYQT